MVKGFFAISQEDSENIVSGIKYPGSRLGIFKTKLSLLKTREKSFIVEKNYPIIVEVEVPNQSVIKFPHPEKFSFGNNSGAIVVGITSWNQVLLQEKIKII